MLHYTDNAGHKAISAQPIWCFKASQPPSGHPVGAYFTSLRPCRNLCARLRIPKSKTEFVFEFIDADDLTPLDGGRGAYVFYSSTDYHVSPSRRVYNGKSEELR